MFENQLIVSLSAGGDASGTLETVVEGATSIVKLAGDMFVTMTQNPVLLLFIGASLASVGLLIFRRMKRAAQ